MREDGQAVDDALYSLAMGPDTRVRHYESCVVGDVRYNTLARDEGRKTQNSAIMSTDTYGKEITEMYANITNIVHLKYISSFEVHRCVVMLCVVGITCFLGSQNPELMIISNPSMSRRRTRPTSLLFWQIKQHKYFSWKTHLHVAMTREYYKGLSRGIRLMKLHNKMMLTLLLMYKITHMFLISLRTITSMTPAKRLPVVLWTYKSRSIRS